MGIEMERKGEEDNVLGGDSGISIVQKSQSLSPMILFACPGEVPLAHGVNIRSICPAFLASATVRVNPLCSHLLLVILNYP